MEDHGNTEAKASLPSASRLRTLAPWLLALLILLVYLPSLGGGFLNWDDPWLIQNSPLVKLSVTQAFRAIFLDLSFDTRMALGAEYLPIRDLSYFIDFKAFGLSPLGLRLSNLLIYGISVVWVYRIGRRLGRSDWSALLFSAVFALHPVHVESVAWLAGRKDVLSLAFGGALLVTYLGECRRRLAWLAVLSFCAVGSKLQSVVFIPLMLVFGWGSGRRLDVRGLLAAILGAACIVPVQLRVAASVGIGTPDPGFDFWARLFTMGPVWLRYAWGLLWPPSLSIVQEVPTLTRLTFLGGLGYVALAGWLAVGLGRFHRVNRPHVLLALLVFIIPLVPVSQFLAPLQNRMADRYLYISVLTLSWIALWIAERRGRLEAGAIAALLVWLTWGSLSRAALFGNVVDVFRDATEKTRNNAIAPYQLAMALQDQGDESEALRYFELVLARMQGRGEVARKATNNLARLLVRAGRLEEAETALRRGLINFPEDSKMRQNLDKVLARKAARGER